MMSVKIEKITLLPKLLVSAFALLIVSCGGGSSDSAGDDASGGGTGGGSPSTLQFSNTQFSVTESTASIQITVNKTGDTSTVSSIDYTITPTGTNLPVQGADYVATNGTLNFAAGEAVQTINITIVNDTTPETDELIQLDLSNPTGAQLGATVRAFLTISDDDSPGQLQFSSAALSVNEGAGNATVLVSRMGGVGGAASVDFATQNGSAIAGEDFVTNSGTLNWADGESGTKSITVAITDDTIFDEGTQNFTVDLTNVVGASLGTLTSSTVSIIENDISGSTNSSLAFVVDTGNLGEEDYAQQLSIPAGFGVSDFTLQLWVKPDNSYSIGNNVFTQWALADVAPDPGDDSSWWFNGNFLLDGHNNNAFASGTFSLQFYGGGRVRWLFGDGSANLLAVQAYPATNAASLVQDGLWHQITLVRRCSGNSATLELWVDGGLIDSTASSNCTNMRNYWDNWTGYPVAEQGWFWGAEKISVLSSGKWEDYKGLLDELRFWSRAMSASEIQTSYMLDVPANATGWVGHYKFTEASGAVTCDEMSNSQCMALDDGGLQMLWNTENAPLQ